MNETLDLLLCLVLLYLLPGATLLLIFQPWLQLEIVDFVCLSAGTSLALAPLLLYLTTLAGIHLNPQTSLWQVAILIGIALVVVVYHRARRRPEAPFRLLVWEAHSIRNGLLLLLIFLLTLVARVSAVQGIDYPLWTDSYHHTLITQVIVETGQVPTTLEPYAEIDHLTYHFGFHTLAAWTHWLTALPVPRSLVFTGQIINALVVLTTYLFAKRLFANDAASLIATSISGLTSFMPAMFVNWGRYTQLTGQILLPVFLALAISTLTPQALTPQAFTPQTQRKSLLSALLIGIVGAGLFYQHYRIFLFACPFIALYALASLIRHRRDRQQVIALLVRGLLFAVTTLLLIFPWVLRMNSEFGKLIVGQVASYANEQHGAYFDFAWSNISEFGGTQAELILASLGLLWGILRRNQSVLILIAWVGSLFLFANLYLVQITPLFSNLIVSIFLYLPISVLAGYLLSEWLRWVFTWLNVLPHPTPSPFREKASVGQKNIPPLPRDNPLPLPGRARVGLRTGLLMAVILAIGVQAIPENRLLVRPENGFVRVEDEVAMQWIQANLPKDSLFHVAWQFWTPRVVHGLDAGYWIPYFTGRQTTVPPEQYAADGTPAYVDSINQRLIDLKQATTTSDLWQRMNHYGITHLYIGKRATELAPAFFESDPLHFELIYDQGGVWIFAIKPPPAAESEYLDRLALPV